MFCAFFARMDLRGVGFSFVGRASVDGSRARRCEHRDAGRAPGAQHGEARLHQEDEDAAV